jgi:hypothetical protein
VSAVPVELAPRGLLIAATKLYNAAVRVQGVWIYAIQAGDEGPVKIGRTKQTPAARLRVLQQGNPQKLRGVAAWRALPDEERVLHADFATARLQGEWFAPAPELLERVRYMGGDFEDWS